MGESRALTLWIIRLKGTTDEARHLLLSLSLSLVICLSTALSAAGQSMFLTAEDIDIPLVTSPDFTLPDFGPSLVNPDYPYEVTTTQTPSPGTVFSGLQTVQITIDGTDTNNNTDSVSFQLTLSDGGEPDVTIGLSSPSGSALATPSGVPYFVAPASVSPTASATDLFDSNVELFTYVDGVLWDGTPVTATGLHTLRVYGHDDAGNVAEESMIFDIRDRPFFNAYAVVESYTCQVGPSGIESIDTTVLLSSDQFFAWDIDLSTVQLWLVDSEGAWLENVDGITICGAYPSPGTYSSLTCQAQYEDNYWRVSFHKTFATPIDADPPAALEITGGGLNGSPDVFDFTATTPTIVDPDPVATLQNLGVWFEDPPADPPEEPEIQCRWVYKWVLEPEDKFVDSRAVGHELPWWIVVVHAWPHYIGAGSDGWTALPYDDVNVAGSVQSGAILQVFLQPSACCEDCEISVIANPRFKARARIDPPAEIATGGKLVVQPPHPCPPAEAEGGVAIGYTDQESVNIFGYNIPVWPGVATQDQPFSDSVNCVVDACSINVNILTEAFTRIYVTWTLINVFGSGHSDLFDSDLNITIVPACGGTQGDPIRVTFPTDHVDF